VDLSIARELRAEDVRERLTASPIEKLLLADLQNAGSPAFLEVGTMARG
jgi:hypothetical protein